MLKRLLPSLFLVACSSSDAPSTTTNTALGRLSGERAEQRFTGTAKRSDDTLVTAAPDGSFVIQHEGLSVHLTGSAGSNQQLLEVQGEASEVLLEPFDDLLRLAFSSEAAPSDDDNSANDTEDDKDANNDKDDNADPSNVGDDDSSDDDGSLDDSDDSDERSARDDHSSDDSDDDNDGSRRSAYFGCEGKRVVRVSYVLDATTLVVAPWQQDASGALTTEVALGCVDPAGQLISQTTIKISLSSLTSPVTVTLSIVRDGVASQQSYQATASNDDDDHVDISIGDDEIFEIAKVAQDIYVEKDGLFFLQ
jgi:hypothetical protein